MTIKNTLKNQIDKLIKFLAKRLSLTPISLQKVTSFTTYTWFINQAEIRKHKFSEVDDPKETDPEVRNR